jgi:hypothetical protein
MRRLLPFLAKAAISVLLLYLSLRRVDLDSVVQRLGGLDLLWFGFILLVLSGQVVLGALRWREIVAVCGGALPLPTALRYNFIGLFFSQVLPSTVGGDAVRIWLLARGGAGWPKAIYSMLIDRIVGVSVLALLVAACLPWTLRLISDPVARAALVLIGVGALTGAVVFLGLGLRHLRIMERWWLTRHLATASRLTWRLCRSLAGARVGAMSLALQVMTALAAWGAARAAHASVEFVQLFYLVLPVVLIATIPVSIAGWGVRESAMVLAFSYAGLAEGDGLIVSILYGAANLGLGAVGGLVWIAGGYRWSSVKTAEAETLAHEPSFIHPSE